MTGDGGVHTQTRTQVHFRNVTVTLESSPRPRRWMKGEENCPSPLSGLVFMIKFVDVVEHHCTDVSNLVCSQWLWTPLCWQNFNILSVRPWATEAVLKKKKFTYAFELWFWIIHFPVFYNIAFPLVKRTIKNINVLLKIHSKSLHLLLQHQKSTYYFITIGIDDLKRADEDGASTQMAKQCSKNVSGTSGSLWSCRVDADVSKSAVPQRARDVKMPRLTAEINMLSAWYRKKNKTCLSSQTAAWASISFNNSLVYIFNGYASF